MKFKDIPQLTSDGAYAVDISWDYLETWLEDHTNNGLYDLDLCPDFQRGHVWTDAQRIAFVEFKLRGGRSGDITYWNHPNWMGSWKGTLELVDGLQRITAVRMFMRDELPAFGHCFSEYEDPRRATTSQHFRVNINNLPTRAAVLRWYLELNSGGTPHSDEEIARVQALLDAEKTA